jgi:hypothetical protein
MDESQFIELSNKVNSFKQTYEETAFRSADYFVACRDNNFVESVHKHNTCHYYYIKHSDALNKLKNGDYVFSIAQKLIYNNFDPVLFLSVTPEENCNIFYNIFYEINSMDMCLSMCLDNYNYPKPLGIIQKLRVIPMYYIKRANKTCVFDNTFINLPKPYLCEKPFTFNSQNISDVGLICKGEDIINYWKINVTDGVSHFVIQFQCKKDLERITSPYSANYKVYVRDIAVWRSLLINKQLHITYVANLFISPYSIKEFEIQSAIINYESLLVDLGNVFSNDFVSFLDEQFANSIQIYNYTEFSSFMAQTILQKTVDEKIKQNKHDPSSYIVTFGQENVDDNLYKLSSSLDFSANEKRDLINELFEDKDNSAKICYKIYLYQHNKYIDFQSYNEMIKMYDESCVDRAFPNADCFRIDNTSFKNIYAFFQQSLKTYDGGVADKKYDRFIIVILLLFVWMLLYAARHLNDAYSYKTHSNDIAQHISFHLPSCEPPYHIRS